MSRNNREILNAALLSIKQEPIDSGDESVEPTGNSSGDYEHHAVSTHLDRIAKRRKSTVDEADPRYGRSSKDYRYDNITQGQYVPSYKRSYQNEASGSGSHKTSALVSSRDPRLKNFTNVNEPRIEASSERRKTFHERSSTAQNVIRVLAPSELIHQQPFFANSPFVPFTSGNLEQRTPSISSNHNALFVSQGTTENVRDVSAGQRYRNNSDHLPIVANQVLADLDAISRSMSEKSSQISYARNTRTFGAQTEPIDQNSSAGQGQNQHKKFESKEVQTTKNSGVFSFVIDDLSKLTRDQRKGLEDFKRLMNCKDEPGTGDLLERIQHRRANQSLAESNKQYYDQNQGRGGSRYHNQYDGHAGPSREVFSKSATPYTKPNSMYANASPK